MRSNVILDELIIVGLIKTLSANVCTLHVLSRDELWHCLKTRNRSKTFWALVDPPLGADG